MVRLPPPLRQEKEDNCALACLRSLLSHYGIEVAEATLEPLANKQDWGVGIEDLAAAARSFNLKTEIAKLDTTAIARCLAKCVFPIAYLNRLHLGKRFPLRRAIALRMFVPHAVVPIRVSEKLISYNDPLTGKRHRAARRKFEAAQADLGNVVRGL